MVYEPREDSWLLLESVKGRKAGSALDMGTGTGIIANELSKSCKQVVAVDIDPEAIAVAKKSSNSKNVQFFVSDLFESVTGSFDLIVFNPPYLPPEPAPEAFKGSKTSEWAGGRPLIMKFLRQALTHLSPQARIILLLSSLTGLEPEELEALGFRVEKKGEHKFFYERLGVYELSVG